ncbi:hypothetical protein QR680_001356 [Steinernema hermaphroditum]|uniref:Kinase n=1 Tax=Steinernema hermaphroditum TaxID=289476 RepID=A0AA39GYP6_9BILA|nr:hypothetical protein QR680_001356 [Steinernema hermaphroditum]
MNRRETAENRKERLDEKETRTERRSDTFATRTTAGDPFSCSETAWNMVRKGFKTPDSTLNDDNAPLVVCDLKPFKHQVGGHAGLFSFGPNYVCKPYDSREASFYKSIPVALLPLTAKYYHHISITKDDDLIPIARVIESASTSMVECDPHPYNYSSENDSVYRDVSSGFINRVNPWAMQCLVKESEKRTNQLVGDFIILENITSKFLRPCVIDLKLGTRQHGDDATPEKKISQKKKCAKTTSQTMGLRLCGLQYFDDSVDMFQCVDKYCGRNMDKKGLIDMIGQFLRKADGTLRTSVCISLLEKIAYLEKVLRDQAGLRLFSSSLLIVYEGDRSHEDSPAVEVRLIDFAHATFNGFLSDHPYDGSDEGCLLGLKTLSDVICKFVDAVL